MPKTADVKWRDWTPEEQKKQPRRVCSIAGCKEAPVRVKETPSSRGSGVRKHVYCGAHVPTLE